MTQSNVADKARHDAMVTRLVEGFVVLGMTKKQAAAYSGFSYDQAKRILNSREGEEAIAEARAVMEKQYAMSKDRAVRGIMDAVDRAKMLGEPGTEIKGWVELSKMHGYYEPTRHQIEVSHDRETLQRQIKEMSKEQLLELATAKDPVIIDGEYTEVRPDD